MADDLPGVPSPNEGFLLFEHETGVELVVPEDDWRRQTARSVLDHWEASQGP